MVAGAVDSRLPQVLVEMARSQRDRVPTLSVELADLLAEKAECYREIAEQTPEELRKVCEVHLALAFTAFIEGRDDALRIVARKTGHAQAKLGIPLEDALRAYRIAGTFCYETLVEPGIPPGGTSPEHLLLASSVVWRIVDSYSETLAWAFREVAEESALDNERARDEMFDGLLEGRITQRVELETAAHVLGIPATGTYIVLVADRLPAAVLTAGGYRSAWRRGVDTQIGIVATEQGIEPLRRLLAPVTAVVGMSTPITDLTDAPSAHQRARIARRCLPSGARGVVAFGDLPIAALVAGAPRLAGDLARDVLGGVLALPPGEREVLLKTLEAWYTDGGSAKAAAGRLYVHPNTVRYRLRRIEDLTGRDLAHPKRVAELYVALQAVRLGTGNRNAGERTG